jgi:hypothetical protein
MSLSVEEFEKEFKKVVDSYLDRFINRNEMSVMQVPDTVNVGNAYEYVITADALDFFETYVYDIYEYNEIDFETKEDIEKSFDKLLNEIFETSDFDVMLNWSRMRDIMYDLNIIPIIENTDSNETRIEWRN